MKLFNYVHRVVICPKESPMALLEATRWLIVNVLEIRCMCQATRPCATCLSVTDSTAVSLPSYETAPSALPMVSKNVLSLCRYITRPAIANERLKRGDVVLQLKSAWRDGTTHIRVSPLEFMRRRAALVPRARLHLIRFHGVLAPNAGLRAAIVPGAPAPARFRY